MSIPYRKLLQKAKEEDFFPHVAIRPQNTWVAILVHSMKKLEDIDQRNHFLWLKCWDNITVRTLKNEYFARHPLENFELKFWDADFLEEYVQVKDLRNHQRTTHAHDDQVLVLRAFEAKDIEEEEQRQQQENLNRLKDRGTDASNAIVLDDDADDDSDIVAICDEQEEDEGEDEDAVKFIKKPAEETFESDSNQETNGGESDEEPDSGSISPRESSEGSHESMESTPTTPDNDERADEQMEDAEKDDWHQNEEQMIQSDHGSSHWHDDNDDSTIPLDDESLSVEYENTNFNEAMEDTDTFWQNGVDTVSEGDANMHQNDGTFDTEAGKASFVEAMEVTNAGTTALMNNPPVKSTKPLGQIAPSLCECRLCSKQMAVKSWTWIGPGDSAICTVCTRQELLNSGNTEDVREMNEAIIDELTEKGFREGRQGIPQNMDEDEPFDYPHDLLYTKTAAGEFGAKADAEQNHLTNQVDETPQKERHDQSFPRLCNKN